MIWNYNNGLYKLDPDTGFGILQKLTKLSQDKMITQLYGADFERYCRNFG